MTAPKPTIPELLADYPFQIAIPVTWGEMDAFQHLNNVHYFRYFETVRVKMFEQVGCMIDGRPCDIGPILAYIEARYKAPVTYPDVLHIGGRVHKITHDRFRVEYRMVGEKLGRVVAVGDSEVVAYDYVNLRKADIPADWLPALRMFQSPAEREG